MRYYNDEWEDFVKNCGFTDEEFEIVALMRRGWYAVDIAEELGISRRTITRKQKSIKDKILHLKQKEQQI